MRWPKTVLSWWKLESVHRRPVAGCGSGQRIPQCASFMHRRSLPFHANRFEGFCEWRPEHQNYSSRLVGYGHLPCRGGGFSYCNQFQCAGVVPCDLWPGAQFHRTPHTRGSEHRGRNRRSTNGLPTWTGALFELGHLHFQSEFRRAEFHHLLMRTEAGL